MSTNMTKERAYEILQLTGKNATTDEIRIQYRLGVLKYHPDKNSDVNAKDKFHEIQHAYEYLTKQPHIFTDINNDEEYDEDTTMDYKTMIGSFISKLFFCKEPDTDFKMKMYKLIVSKILGLCEQKALKYIEKIDNTTLEKIYEILQKYRDACHISDAIMNKIEEILSKTRECVLLNPFLEDLLDDNLYKITENGQTFIVPLWHYELVYDNSGVDFVVRCCPVVPENMEIDEHNNIYIHLSYKLTELWGKETILVSFGNRTLSFLTSHLYLTSLPQTIRLRSMGISHIHKTDLFDNKVRKDVILVIKITGV